MADKSATVDKAPEVATATENTTAAPADQKARKPRFTVSLTLTPELAAILDERAKASHTVRSGEALKILAAGVNYVLPKVLAKPRAAKMPAAERKIYDSGRRAQTQAIMAAIERGEMVNPADFALDKYLAVAKAEAAKVVESKPAAAAAA